MGETVISDTDLAKNENTIRANMPIANCDGC